MGWGWGRKVRPRRRRLRLWLCGYPNFVGIQSKIVGFEPVCEKALRPFVPPFCHDICELGVP
jgi:hypothetical protein